MLIVQVEICVRTAPIHVIRQVYKLAEAGNIYTNTYEFFYVTQGQPNECGALCGKGSQRVHRVKIMWQVSEDPKRCLG